VSVRRTGAGDNRPSSPSSVLSDLAPARNSGWLLGLQRADPSAPLDECGSLPLLWAHCAVLDQEMQEGPYGQLRSTLRKEMNPITPRTRSLSRGHYPGVGCPGDPASRRHRQPRGRPGSAALAPGAARGCFGLATGDASASRHGWTRMGASAEEIHCRSVNERRVGHATPHGFVVRVVRDEGSSDHADPAILRPPPPRNRRTRGCHGRLRSRFRLYSITRPCRAGPRWSGAERHAHSGRSRGSLRHSDRGSKRRGDEC
jgi:hypothetical protein